MDNYTIADNFSLLSKLMDIHGDNIFKAKSYAAAAFTIEKLPMQLSEMPLEKIQTVRGIGASIGKNVIEQIQTGSFSILQEYIQKTPDGILTMMLIKGIGPKKIATIWKELEIETVGELLYACEENRLANYKGFGEKSQQNIKEAIRFYLGSQGSYLYQQIEIFVQKLQDNLVKQFPDFRFSLSGSFALQSEIISELCWITTSPIPILEDFFALQEFQTKIISDSNLQIEGSIKLPIYFIKTTEENFYNCVFKHSCSEAFLIAWKEQTNWSELENFSSDIAIFESKNIPFIPVCQRENASIIQDAIQKKLKPVIQMNDVKSIIHSHSNWSDGAETLEAMAKAAKEKGYEYLVISDHSQSAFYANGLREERIVSQHQQIDELNKKLQPFRIFKSIESDILNEGSLDYNEDVLERFDLVIASIHSNLKMTEEKAMMRLMNAIENPFTSILGHPTGRLLLSRNGYPIDHRKIIDACVANNVVIELNAHPRRLDIDWRWIKEAVDKGVLISINPDAHSIEGFDDCRYGVLVAQKAGLTKYQNLSSYTLAEFEEFLIEQHQKRY
jgi:DNA polymerase (family 10)